MLRSTVLIAVAVIGSGIALVGPASASAPAGANVPFTEYDSVNAAATNGTVTSASRAFTQLAAEATGRRAVHLGAGQYVEFVLARPADAVDIRYSVPDGSADSSLQLTVGGAAHSAVLASLPTTAKYSHFYGNYPFTKNPADGGQHHYFDDTRALLGRVLPAGTRVRITAASPTTVDVADFENVAPAAARGPAGSLSVLDFGADPTGTADSGQAMRSAPCALRVSVLYRSRMESRLPSIHFSSCGMAPCTTATVIGREYGWVHSTPRSANAAAHAMAMTEAAARRSRAVPCSSVTMPPAMINVSRLTPYCPTSGANALPNQLSVCA